VRTAIRTVNAIPNFGYAMLRSEVHISALATRLDQLYITGFAVPFELRFALSVNGCPLSGCGWRTITRN